MSGDYADFVRRRRRVLGLSQRALARRANIKQPLIAAIEVGNRRASDSTRVALDEALAIRPSDALMAIRDQVLAVFAREGLGEPKVFGSVARGDDDLRSDLDLVVEFTDRHDIVDLLALEEELSDLLTVPVDIVDARATGTVTDRARAEAIAL